jgi:hypothetical protein
MGLYDTIWIVYYHGYQIKVIRKGKSQLIRELKVNGVIVPNIKVISYMDWATIHANYCFSNIEREIEVRFATKTGMFDLSTGFQVFIDGEYIGNDKNTSYPPLKETVEKTEKGFWNHFFFVGLLQYGLLFYVPQVIGYFAIKNYIKLNNTELLLYLMANFLAFLLIFAGSCYSWHQTKLIMKNLKRFEQKWR